MSQNVVTKSLAFVLCVLLAVMPTQTQRSRSRSRWISRNETKTVQKSCTVRHLMVAAVVDVVF